MTNRPDSRSSSTSKRGRRLVRLCIGVLAVAISAQAAGAKISLKERPEIFDQLLQIGIAHEIREKCETLSARTLKAKLRLLQIYNEARALGYSYEEVKVYTRDKDEQERLRQAAYAYLDEHGVNRDDPTSYCPLGLQEMKSKSQIGNLLKAN